MKTENQAKTVLITGASGFIGHQAVHYFADRGFRVKAVLRKQRNFHLPGIQEVLVPDLSDEAHLQPALNGVDAVVHCAAHNPLGKSQDSEARATFYKVNVRATELLATAAVKSRVKRFVLLSSTKVNGERTPAGSYFTEESLLNPQDFYGQSKLDAENVLSAVTQSSGTETVIIRPPPVYGPHARGNIGALFRWVRQGIPLPFGAIEDNKRSFIGIDNLLDCISMCISHPAAARQTFLVSDNECVSTAALVRKMGDALQRPARLIRIQKSVISAIGHFAGQSDTVDRLFGSMQIDSSKVRSQLGWDPPLTLDEGLRRMAATQ